MRIGIGAILGIVGGPATYARELIHALARIDPQTEFVIFVDAPELLGSAAPNVRCVRAPLGSTLLQPAWDHGLVPLLVRQHRVQLYHGTKGTLPLVCGCPQLVTIHDLAVYHQPQTFAVLQRVHQRTHTPFAVRRAVRVITVSEFGRRDVLDRFRLPPERVVAIPHGVGTEFSPHAGAADEATIAQLGLRGDFLLYVGTIQPRKNVDLLVEAFAGARNPNAVELLIAGRTRPGYTPRWLQARPANVRYIGPVADDLLPVLYRRALGFCSFSSYEGFGLTLLEAMASGCVVLAARNSAVPEVVGEAGLLADEVSLTEIRRLLEMVMSAPQSVQRLRAASLRRAAAFTWENTARRTLAVYREALEGTRAAA